MTPNILLIVSDQHRLDCVGASGAYPVSTPHLDALAAGGMWFGHAFTPIPLCTPARQSLLTGRRPETHGGLWNYDLGSRIPALRPDEYSWARELQRADYATQYVGKWHVNPDHGPTEFGYDQWVQLEQYEAWRLERYPEHPMPNDWFGAVDPVPTEDSRTHWLARQTSEFIREMTASRRPWHARLDFLEPHLPCLPTAEFAALFAADEIPEWLDFGDALEGKPYIQRQQRVNWGVENYTWSDWAPVVARYYAVICQMDAAIGTVLQTLDEVGGAEDTLVIYTSDHGDMCGAHGMMDKHYIMYDDVVRVPLILRWPGRIPAGSRSESFAYNTLDLPPTIASIVGFRPPPVGHGMDLFSRDRLQFEESSDIAERRHVVSTYNGQQFGLFSQRMIRTKAWKYVWNLTDTDELYDMLNDPNEITNCIASASLHDIVQELRLELLQQLQRDGDSLVANDWIVDQLTSGRKLVR